MSGLRLRPVTCGYASENSRQLQSSWQGRGSGQSVSVKEIELTPVSYMENRSILPSRRQPENYALTLTPGFLNREPAETAKPAPPIFPVIS